MRIQTDQYIKQIVIDRVDIRFFIFNTTTYDISAKDSGGDDLKKYTPIFCNTFIDGIERK